MSLWAPFCDRCTKLATTVIPRKDGEERYCDYHWQMRMERLTREVVVTQVKEPKAWRTM